MTAPVTPAVPVKPSVWTNPNWWVTQIGAIVAVLVALAGLFHWNASFTGLLAQITAPVAFAAALGFEIAWVVHHDGLTKLGLTDFINWLQTNVEGLKAVLGLVAHVPALAKLALALDNAGVKDVEQFVVALTQHLIDPTAHSPATVAAVAAPLGQGSVTTTAPSGPTDAAGNPAGGGTAHAGVLPDATPPAGSVGASPAT